MVDRRRRTRRLPLRGDASRRGIRRPRSSSSATSRTHRTSGRRSRRSSSPGARESVDLRPDGLLGRARHRASARRARRVGRPARPRRAAASTGTRSCSRRARGRGACRAQQPAGVHVLRTRSDADGAPGRARGRLAALRDRRRLRRRRGGLDRARARRRGDARRGGAAARSRACSGPRSAGFSPTHWRREGADVRLGVRRRADRGRAPTAVFAQSSWRTARGSTALRFSSGSA